MDAFLPTVMWGLSDLSYKNTSIHDGFTCSEIIPSKKSVINKNGGEGDLVIAEEYIGLAKTDDAGSLFIEGHAHK